MAGRLISSGVSCRFAQVIHSTVRASFNLPIFIRPRAQVELGFGLIMLDALSMSLRDHCFQSRIGKALA